MGRISLTGVIVTIVGFVILASIIASNIEIGGQPVDVTQAGLTAANETSASSVLSTVWNSIFENIELDLWPW